MKFTFLKSWNLRTKFMVILVLFILAPLMISGALFYNSSTNFVIQKTDKESLQVLTLVMQNVNQLLKGYETQLSDIYEHKEIVKQLGAIPQNQLNGGNPKVEEDDVNRYLRDFLRGKDDLDSIYLFTPQKTYFGDLKGPNLFIRQYRRHPQWDKAVSAAAGRAVWLPTYELPPNQYNSKPSYYFMVGMQIKNVFDALQTIGTLLLNVKIDALNRILDHVQVTPNSELLISDAQGHIIWNQNPEVYGKSLASYAFFKMADRKGRYYSTQKVNGKLYRIGFLRSDFNDWYYFSFVPQADMNAQSNALKRFLTATLFAFAALFILLAALTSNFITRPIRRMALAMKQIHRDDFEMKPLTQSGDEIGMLQASFQSMRGRIHDLIKEVRLISDKEREAEVRALQAQINPHFVYNTLDAINWMAIEKRQTQISEMITSLSDIMRYAIKPGEQMVTVEEELKWARSYAYLQESRFEEKFRVDFEVDEDARFLKIPKLVLQPYLENSIIHGMEDIESGGVVRISVRCESAKQVLEVTIEDNGSGIAEDKLRQIKERRSHGIGIYNLDDRLKMEYGPDYGVNIDSTYGTGTKVTIILPYIH